jgi:hypothetical protein
MRSPPISSISLQKYPDSYSISLSQKFLRAIAGQDKGKIFIAPDFDAPLPDDILG